VCLTPDVNHGGLLMTDNEARQEHERFEKFSLSIDKDFAVKHPDTVQALSKHQLIYSIAGLLLGLACTVGGVILSLNGVIGSTSWTAKFLGAESQINDAAPGVMLFIVGLFIVFFTRYVFKVHK
jgi:hypothetical protein